MKDYSTCRGLGHSRLRGYMYVQEWHRKPILIILEANVSFHRSRVVSYDLAGGVGLQCTCNNIQSIFVIVPLERKHLQFSKQTLEKTESNDIRDPVKIN